MSFTTSQFSSKPNLTNSWDASVQKIDREHLLSKSSKILKEVITKGCFPVSKSSDFAEAFLEKKKCDSLWCLNLKPCSFCQEKSPYFLGNEIS